MAPKPQNIQKLYFLGTFLTFSIDAGGLPFGNDFEVTNRVIECLEYCPLVLTDWLLSCLFATLYWLLAMLECDWLFNLQATCCMPWVPAAPCSSCRWFIIHRSHGSPCRDSKWNLSHRLSYTLLYCLKCSVDKQTFECCPLRLLLSVVRSVNTWWSVQVHVYTWALV